ncbi:MAG: hypothetical protein RBR22_08250 [Desulfuromonas sp.]|nr:hypothetical protein [Desulfuromonas sp.]
MSGNIDQTTEFLQSFATTALQRAADVSGRPSIWNANTPNIGFSHTVKQPSMSAPPKIGDLLNDNEKQDVNVLLLNDTAEAWIKKYFPNINSCLSYQPEEWACGILSGEKPFGLNKEHFEAVWHDGRDRAYRQAGAERLQVLADYSMRGFSQPAGATIAAMRSADMRASEAISDINRQQTIKDAEITLELIKFAAETAARLKTALMQMLSSFFGNIVQLAQHDPGADKLRAKAQAYSAFMGGLSSYYNVELGFEELRLNAAKAKSGVEEASAKIKGEHTLKGVDSRNQALGQAARGFADAAGAAANAQSSLQAELFSGQV